MRKYHHPPIESLSLDRVLYALSDPVRLSFVNNLAQNGEQSCGALTVNIAKSTASHHFRVLRESGIIHMQAEGTHYINSLRKADLESRFPGLLDAILLSSLKG
jgi:DNA-binding transcriptional ArsR family regulator